MKLDITIFNEPLTDVLRARKPPLFTYPKEKIWNPEGISLSARIGSEKVRTAVQVALTPANISKYIVPANVKAPTRCIDGRITKGWQPPADGQPVVLGPKIAGGTAHAALAHRIVDVGNLKDNLLFEDDIKHVIKRYKEIGFGFGGHIDDHQSRSNTGCGAVDNIHLILDRLQRPEPQEQLRGLTKMILDDAYDSSIMNEVIGRMLYLDALKPRYMPKENDDPNGVFLYKRTIVDTIRHEAAAAEETVPALTGTHNEIAIILNFVTNTTLDTDRFSYDHGNYIQVFGWDVWEMYEEARNLYPYDMHENVEDQHAAIKNRIKHLTTRTLLGLATAMVLTDGSLKLITVREK